MDNIKNDDYYAYNIRDDVTPICTIVVEVIEIIALVTYLLYVDKAIEFLNEN